MSIGQGAPVALVVDDDAFSRKKLSAALKSLNVNCDLAENGVVALEKLKSGSFDLILMDILMPEKDGFDVLEDLQSDDTLRDIPVLVISSLEETDETVRALELGAVDFLPKNVEHAILKARVLSSLEKKRLRDQEIAYLRDVELLTSAAKNLQSGQTGPSGLNLASVAHRRDPLGNLARVFSELAIVVHDRETRARQRFNLLQGTFLLLVMGLTWGLVPALSKLMVGSGGSTPIGLAAWVAIVSLLCVGFVMSVRGIRPRFTKNAMRFALVAGLFAGVLPQVVLFWVSSHVPGISLSITLALESMIVFAIAATLRMESASLSRFGGLMVGLCAVIIIMFSTKEADSIGLPLWVLAGVLVPFCYAVESILVASMPTDDGRPPIELLFLLMLGSTIWGWSAAVLTGSALVPWHTAPEVLIFAASIGVISAVSNGSFVVLIRKMGSVFASQYAYVVTIMGVGWSILLLAERPTPWIMVALACVLLGMLMVRPKEEPVSLAEILSDDNRREANVSRH